MDFKKLIKDNYESIVQRGLITPSTTVSDFIEKLDEEVSELYHATDPSNEIEELADVILVCLNYARHFNIDIEKALHDKILTNKKRGYEGL